jgi:hypothetical protein
MPRRVPFAGRADWTCEVVQTLAREDALAEVASAKRALREWRMVIDEKKVARECTVDYKRVLMFLSPDQHDSRYLSSPPSPTSKQHLAMISKVGLCKWVPATLPH